MLLGEVSATILPRYRSERLVNQAVDLQSRAGGALPGLWVPETRFGLSALGAGTIVGLIMQVLEARVE